MPYTIRLHANNVKLTKSQKQIIRRFERYLKTGDIHYENKGLPQQHSFTIETVKPEFTTERYELYKKYQMAIHQDKLEELTEDKFKRFLIHSPLYEEDQSDPVSVFGFDITNIVKYMNPTSNNESTLQNTYQPNSSSSSNSSSILNSNLKRTNKKYGTFHQLYRIDDKLIAVGVIDLLPTGLSSVYMFYDPDYRFLVLGKYTAICELQFCQENNYPYYYMGFYIHTCEKMNYKAEFGPCELLCIQTLQWFDFQTVCKPLLNVQKFTAFHPDCVAKDAESDGANEQRHSQRDSLHNFACDNDTVSKIKLDIRQNRVFYLHHLTQASQGIVEPIIKEWIKMCGSDIAEKITVRL